MLASFSSLATAAPFKTSFRNQIRSGFLLFLRLLTRDKRRHYTFYVKADVFIDSARNSATKWFLNLAKFKQPDSHWPMFILEDVCYCCIIAVLTLVPLMREKRVAGFKITMLFPTLVKSCSWWWSGVFPQFMQRGLDAETKKQLEEDEKRIISDEHWYLDLPELKAKE